MTDDILNTADLMQNNSFLFEGIILKKYINKRNHGTCCETAIVSTVDSGILALAKSK